MDSGDGSSRETKRQQFTSKQRMDMYAFCVLELEMHSNKVSIKKQQQAIQKVLYEQQRGGSSVDPNGSHNTTTNSTTSNNNSHEGAADETESVSVITMPTASSTPQQNGHAALPNGVGTDGGGSGEKTLLQLQQEVAMTRKSYSDYQKTQVLTSSMLRDVQKRFAKYYPDSAIPSRTTIKHVFEKCVAHGTVENIKTPRKATKIPQGDEIEYLLIHEPQLSLRQMAQKLNVSTGTVSRRCKALGLIPESVTIKHQQLATARRQRQIKQLESQSKNGSGSGLKMEQ